MNLTTAQRKHIDPPRLGMRSGQGDALDGRHNFAVGKSGRAWLWRPGEPSFVYCTDRAEWSYTGRGFGGAHLPLRLTDAGAREYEMVCDHKACGGDHSKFVLYGGWHSNSGALLDETGVDLTQLFVTWGCVSLAVHYNTGVSAWVPATQCGILHVDPPEGGVGDFDRIKHIAERFADEFQRPVYYYSSSTGGASAGPVLPDGWQHQDDATKRWYEAHKEVCYL